MIEQACQKIPNVVTEQIIIDEKYRTRLLPVTADKDIIDEINKEFQIIKKERELLNLFKKNFDTFGEETSVAVILDTLFTINDLEDEISEMRKGRREIVENDKKNP
jgi:hypothetical protein